MRWLLRNLRRLVVSFALLIVLLVLPVGYTEVACRGEAVDDAREALVSPEHRRDESRTYTTYPEWHIVHAYEDYARVISTGDPHDFGYLRAIRGFWSSLCPLARQAAAHGGFTSESKMTIYTIGVSFTAELLAKAAYEETVGRVFAWIRGSQRAPLDDVSAEQAADYAAFLQQTPWYKWDFAEDIRELDRQRTIATRDRERATALGIEYSVKAAYAKVIADAVAATGEDELRLRSVVSGLPEAELTGVDGVTVIGPAGDGVEIETPRYRAFTRIAEVIADAGGGFIEIAGNDDILLTATGPAGEDVDALATMPRQGADDMRYLIDVSVEDLARVIRDMAASGLTLEHIHDY